MWELVGRHQSCQHTDGQRTKHFDYLVPCNPLQSFRDEVRAARRDSERDDSAKMRRTMQITSAGKNDLERAFVEFERADAAEADAAALLAGEQSLLESAGCGTMVELAEQLQGLKDASGANTIAEAVDLLRGAAGAAAATGPPLLKPGLQALRYADCTDADVDVLTYHEDRGDFDAFLDMINVKKDDNDPGECTRLRRFQQAKSDERKGKKRRRKKGAGRKRKMEWKDEYLLWSCYVHCGWTKKQTARLFKVAPPTVSDIVRTWTVYLDQALALLMPNPTKPELLRSYPRHTIRMLGHARVGMNLDATDTQGETPRFADSQSASYSTYHSQTGAKTLAGCTPIGAVPHSWVTEAYPSAISDEKQVKKTGILDNLRPHDAVNVDRGFCIENLAIRKKVVVIRPQKKMHNQTQFSVADANMQHKVGTTRIVIEQKNSHAKKRCGYLQRVTPASQFDMVSAIIRIAFCMTNFNAPVTPGVHSGSTENRACCAGVLWLGHDEPETVNALCEPELWCSRSQLDLHRRLSRVLTGSDFNAALVSELVLVETSLEKSASNREEAARTRWVNWRERNSDWEMNQGKHAHLRSLALETLAACDAARKSAGRLGAY
jgi:hypothetical protein